jgi:hypothetical protein
MPSFSTRTLIRWDSHVPEKKKYVYEERITLWKAKDVEAAIKKSEKEAMRYARESGNKYLGFIQSYWLFDEIAADGVEVFSLLRESDLPPKKYIDAYFDTGSEKQRKRK